MDYGYLMKDTDACNQKVTPSTTLHAVETPGTLVMKRSSHESIKSRDSEISFEITMKSSLENQEIAKVSYNKCLAIAS